MNGQNAYFQKGVGEVDWVTRVDPALCNTVQLQIGYIFTIGEWMYR